MAPPPSLWGEQWMPNCRPTLAVPLNPHLDTENPSSRAQKRSASLAQVRPRGLENDFLWSVLAKWWKKTSDKGLRLGPDSGHNRTAIKGFGRHLAVQIKANGSKESQCLFMQNLIVVIELSCENSRLSLGPCYLLPLSPYSIYHSLLSR